MNARIAIAVVPFLLLACGAGSEPIEGGSTSDLTTTPPPHVDVDKIVMGDGHVCALLKEGTVRCWGGREIEQLAGGCHPSTDRAMGAGVSSSTDRSIRQLEGVIDLSAAASHTCAVIRDGSVRCWGGDESVRSTGSNSPVRPISGIADVAEVATTFLRTCARLNSGEVRCWGDKVSPDSDNFVPGWADATSIVAHTTFGRPLNLSGEIGTRYTTTCITVGSGGMTCQEMNLGYACHYETQPLVHNFAFTELRGASMLALSSSERAVPSASRPTELDVHHRRSLCGVVDGELRCAGLERSFVYQFPNHNVSDGEPMVTRIPEATGHVATTDTNVCFLREGKVFCAGADDLRFHDAKPVPGIEDAVTVAMGEYQGSNACALRADSSIVCWTTGADGTPSNVTAPLYLPPETP